MELDDAGRDEDIFELQHHHLLRCLERTTVRTLLVYTCFNIASRFLCNCESEIVNSKVISHLSVANFYDGVS